MAGIDLTTAQEKLQIALDTRRKILQRGQAFAQDGKRLDRADLEAVNKDIRFWQNQVRQLSQTSGVRVQRVVFYG
jgi:hypothetical protein